MVTKNRRSRRSRRGQKRRNKKRRRLRRRGVPEDEILQLVPIPEPEK